MLGITLHDMGFPSVACRYGYRRSAFFGHFLLQKQPDVFNVVTFIVIIRARVFTLR